MCCRRCGMKTSPVTCLILMTVWLATPALAQTVVTGTVVDARTEQPIKGVVVYVEHHSIIAESDRKSTRLNSSHRQ